MMGTQNLTMAVLQFVDKKITSLVQVLVQILVILFVETELESHLRSVTMGT